MMFGDDLNDTLPMPVIETVAERFRLLSDPTRLQILNDLHAHGERAVGELVSSLGLSYATASKQLALLRAHRVVARRREGNRVFYRISDPSLEEVCTVVCQSVREHWAQWGKQLEATLPIQ